MAQPPCQESCTNMAEACASETLVWETLPPSVTSCDAIDPSTSFPRYPQSVRLSLPQHYYDHDDQHQHQHDNNRSTDDDDMSWRSMTIVDTHTHTHTHTHTCAGRADQSLAIDHNRRAMQRDRHDNHSSVPSDTERNMREVRVADHLLAMLPSRQLESSVRS